MRRKPRTAYLGDRYPRRGGSCDRRRFLVDLGLASGVAAVSLALGRSLQAADGGAPRSTPLPGGGYRVELPAAPDLHELLVQGSPSLDYRITVVAATQEVATFIEKSYLTLYGKLDAVLAPYTHQELLQAQKRAEAEGRLLEALRAAHCAAASCKVGDLSALTLTTQEALYDQTIGCSCATLPWRRS